MIRKDLQRYHSCKQNRRMKPNLSITFIAIHSRAMTGRNKTRVLFPRFAFAHYLFPAIACTFMVIWFDFKLLLLSYSCTLFVKISFTLTIYSVFIWMHVVSLTQIPLKSSCRIPWFPKLKLRESIYEIMTLWTYAAALLATKTVLSIGFVFNPWTRSSRNISLFHFLEQSQSPPAKRAMVKTFRI